MPPSLSRCALVPSSFPVRLRGGLRCALLLMLLLCGSLVSFFSPANQPSLVAVEALGISLRLPVHQKLSTGSTGMSTSRIPRRIHTNTCSPHHHHHHHHQHHDQCSCCALRMVSSPQATADASSTANNNNNSENEPMINQEIVLSVPILDPATTTTPSSSLSATQQLINNSNNPSKRTSLSQAFKSLFAGEDNEFLLTLINVAIFGYFLGYGLEILTKQYRAGTFNNINWKSIMSVQTWKSKLQSIKNYF